MKIQKVKFKSNGDFIRGTILYPQKMKLSNPSIIFFHGWASNEKRYIERAKYLVKLGYICFAFNLRGHGTSDGDIKRLSREDHLNDIIAAYKYLIKQDYVDKAKISLVGKSYGGYLSIIASSKINFNKLILIAPALYPDEDFDKPTYELIKKNPNIFRQYKTDYRNNIALRSFRNFEKEKMLIVCEKDEEVPRSITDCYKNSVNNYSNFTYKVIKDTDHTFSKEEWNINFIKILIQFFKL